MCFPDDKVMLLLTSAGPVQLPFAAVLSCSCCFDWVLALLCIAFVTFGSVDISPPSDSEVGQCNGVLLERDNDCGG